MPPLPPHGSDTAQRQHGGAQHLPGADTLAALPGVGQDRCSGREDENKAGLNNGGDE